MKKVKEFIKELRKTDRGKAIFKLSLWLIGFLILFILAGIMRLVAPKQNNNTNSFDTVAALKKLSTINFEYKYDITYNGINSKYEGTKYNDLYEGYYESNNGIIKFHIEKDQSYQIVNDGYAMIDSIYSNIDDNYINFNLFASYLETLNGIQSDNKVIFNLVDKKIVVLYSNNLINKITIDLINGHYELSFVNYSNINKINSMDEKS